MSNNLTKFKQVLKDKKLDGFIVTNQVNIFYLTGFKGLSPTEREAILAVTPQTTTLITAKLYQSEAKFLAGTQKGLKAKIASERNQISQFIKSLLQGTKKIGFETDLTFGEYKEFKKNLAGTRLQSFKNLVNDLRAIKSDDEIAKIEKAQVISHSALEQIIKTINVGQTEEEIASKLSSIIKSLGGQGLAFESIIASGPNSGRPHYFTGNRRLTMNDMLLLDFGAKFQDYCADLSRTIFIGKAKDNQKNIYNHVLNAQKSAIEKISHGSKSHEIHTVASDIFKDQKLHKYFLHGLGHGIGLEVHESPHLRPLSKSKEPKPTIEELKEGMVFSIEPGLYFPWGGVRIEDLVVIQNGKAKVLGKTVKEMVEIN